MDKEQKWTVFRGLKIKMKVFKNYERMRSCRKQIIYIRRDSAKREVSSLGLSKMP